MRSPALLRVFALTAVLGVPMLHAQRRHAAAPTPTALLDRAAALYTSGSLRADFTQTIRNPITLTDVTSAGTYLQRRAGVFSVNFSRPAGDRIVSDGRTMWVYVPSATPGQVLKLSVGATTPGGIDLVGQFFSSPSRRWTVTDGGSVTLAGATARRVNLAPRSTDSGIRSAAIWLDPATAAMRQLEITEPSGLVRVLQFPRIVRGAAMAASAFTFTPPQGVTVVDQAALMR
jgi:outer membrane lipoprotein carrier protein